MLHAMTHVTPHIQPMATLGALDDLVFWVFVLITVGSGIINALNKAAKKTPAKGGAQAGIKKPSRAGAAATRRRAQMEKLAGNRGATPVTNSTPNNLTLAESRQRAQARAAYEARAQAMRSAGQEADAPRQAQQAQQAQARAQAAAQQKRQALAQQQALARQRAAAAAQRRPSAPLNRPTPTAPSAQRALGAGVLDILQEDDSQIDHGESVVHRHVRDTEAAKVNRRHPAAMVRHLNRQSLRTALILKEILDKPVSLRW